MSQGKWGFRGTGSGSSRATARRPSRTRCRVVVSAWLFLVLHPLFGQEVATHRWPVKVLQRFMVPFRSNPFSQSSVRPCGPPSAACRTSASTVPSRTKLESSPVAQDADHPALLAVRSDHGGPQAHHWLELDSPAGDMTFGYGPATLPFIDSGEVSLQDRYGNTKWVSGMHFLPWLTLPPIKYRYAPAPGQGRIIGKPIPLTMAQSEALARKWQHSRFVGPYIPFFHDCRSFTCAVMSSAQGRSTVPCYLLFKGYW